MPLLTLSLSEILDKNTLEKIAEALTDVTSRVLRKEPSVTRVDINTVSMFLAGKATVGFTYSLSISITEGTNSEEECEAWLRQANSISRIRARQRGYGHLCRQPN
ncbi:hypothetical protein SHDE107825_13555 [Shewanella denitrificans]|jgi:4-oxalocrotonate tautomerase